jgi:hypothetical protein
MGFLHYFTHTVIIAYNQTTMPKEDKDATPLSTKEAHALLATVRYAALAPVFRDPDFAMLTALAFAGFRVDVNGYANPLVRKRLAEEASRNIAFADKLRELAKAAAAAPPPVRTADGAPKTATRPAPTPEAAEIAATQAYRVERDRLKKERDDEAQRRRAAEHDLTQARMDALAANVDRTEAEKELARTKQRAERLERKLRRAEQTNAELLKAISTRTPPQPSPESKPAPVPAVRAPASRGVSPAHEGADFIEAVRLLLDKPKGGVARQIAADVLRLSPANCAALEIHALASHAAGDNRAASTSWKSLLSLQVAHAAFTDAADTLIRVFTIAPDPKAAREYFTALGHHGTDIESVRERLDHLRGTQPDTYHALRETAQGELQAVLFTERARQRTGADDPLPVTLPGVAGRVVTARLIVGWIDQNRQTEVDALRKAVKDLPADQVSLIAEAVNAITENDGSYVALIKRPVLAGPAIMDASNVAWHGQEMIAAPKPRMSQILTVRRSMRYRGHYPSLLIADANLPYVVDDTALARQMVADGQIILVTSGTDADEYILREARRLHAPIVTNDYMAEYDPTQEVLKLQYSIAHATGRASIYE